MYLKLQILRKRASLKRLKLTSISMETVHVHLFVWRLTNTILSFSVDAIVSNMVLENEIGLVNSAISAYHGNVPDDLMDHKQALEIKMNMLVIQVQTGGLSIDQYLANVKARIEQDKKCALVFKRAGRLDLAKQALRRKKIAQDEVDEAETAMAQQAEEEDEE
jgi:hypothetical protein